MSEMNELLGELAAKVNQMPGDVSSRLDAIEKELRATKENTGIDVARKIKFQGDANTKGSKFSGLTSADVQILHGIMKSTKGGPSEELENAFQHVSKNFINNSKVDAIPYRKATQNEAAAGYGQELIGVQYVGELWDAARQDSRVFGLLDSLTCGPLIMGNDDTVQFGFRLIRKLARTTVIRHPQIGHVIEIPAKAKHRTGTLKGLRFR